MKAIRRDHESLVERTWLYGCVGGNASVHDSAADPNRNEL